MMTNFFDTALAHHQAGHLDKAEEFYRAALRERPDHPQANNNMAVLMRAMRRWDDALEYYDRAVKATPDDPQIYNNMSCVFSDLGRQMDAWKVIRAAIMLRPDYAEAWFNLGNVLRDLGAREQAKLAYSRAIRLQPNDGHVYSNLGDVHKSQSNLTLAALSYQKALQLAPHLPQPYVNLGEVLKEQGRVTEAITLFQQALEKHSTLSLLHSNLLFALHYSPHVPPEIIARAHRHWGERHAASLAPAQPYPFTNVPNPHRRLRVGYVSPDFCGHAVSCFLEPLIRHHDRSAVEIFAYPISRRTDATTARFQAMAGHWNPLVMLTDEEAAARIRADRIDILVDVAGHTADCRPLIFARRAAPVQISWLGYPDTTGITEMDYRLTDAVADPPGDSDAWHTERLERLPNGFLAFRPSVDAARPAAAPFHANGHVTFGSFNNNSKITPEVVALWARLLQIVPTARLILKSRSFADKTTIEHYSNQFKTHGISGDRFDLLPQTVEQSDHLRVYDRIDIALDPFPYNGTTTSCEALWMGVPVVTLTGRHHVSRVTASILTRCGLQELIAADADSYVAIAASLANDPARLDALRGGMRQRLQGSPLCDHDGFAAQVENAYRRMWAEWCTR